MQFRKGRKSPWMIQYRDESGKLKAASFARKEDAQTFESKLHRERTLKRQGLATPKDDLLLIDYAKTFLRRRYKNPELTLATVEGDNRRLKNYWIPKFGVRPLISLTTADLKEALDEIQFVNKRSPAERNRHRALMHKLFQEAFMDEKVVFNPVARIPLVKEINSKKRVALSDEDQTTYLEALSQLGEQYRMMGDLLLWTGARICTVNVLQYQDIDFNQNTIRLRRLEERAGGSKVVERQKGEGVNGETVIPLLPVLREAIHAHRKKAIYRGPPDYIACRAEGKYIPYDTWKDVHISAVKNAKLPKFTSHDIRRTFATNAKRAGLTRAEIREMLGHSSEYVTARYDLKDISHLSDKARTSGFGEVKEGNVVKLRGRT